MQTIQINENIRLHHIMSEKFKTTSISVLIRQPLTRKNATKNAIIPMLLRRGTKNYPNQQNIQNKMEQLSGAIFDVMIMKKGEEQLIQFYIETLNGNVQQAIDFLEEAIMHPLIENNGFKRDFLETEKQNLRNRINERLNDKKEYAKLRCIEEMCKDEPFGVFGDGYENDLDKLTPEGLFEHYTKMLKSAPIECVVIGNTETNELTNQFKSVFNSDRIKTEEENPKKTAKTVKPKTIIEEMDIIQGKLCIGLCADTENTGDSFYHLQLVNEIFGGGPESKLFMNVREKESLCYYVNSFVYRFKTILLVQSGVEKESYKKASELIIRQLDDIKNGKITKDEVEKAKLSLIKKMKSIVDYQTQVMDFYLTQQMLSDSDNIDDIIKRISGATKQNCIDAAQKIYSDTIYFLSPKEEREA